MSHLGPRYIYSSHVDEFLKADPFLASKSKTLTRFIGLGSLPGPYKHEESKTTYIQAIEIEPLTSIPVESFEMKPEEMEHVTKCPFDEVEAEDGQNNTGLKAQSKAELMKLIEAGEDRLKKLKILEERKREEKENTVYERDGNLIYISGFEKHVPQEDIR